jgi:hypothetical protein
MLIGLSGKIGSGKDTAAIMLRYLSAYGQITEDKSYEAFKEYFEAYKERPSFFEEPWLLISAQFGANCEIKKFAGKLKQIVALVTGCKVEDLEDQDFKSKSLGEDWIRYGTAQGFSHHYKDGEKTETVMNNVPCSKEEYEAHALVNWQTAYKHEHTYRTILQQLGTEVCRNIHPNFWINALFADYKPQFVKYNNPIPVESLQNPTWIISDVRFKNEADEIKKRGGIVIRLNRTRVLDMVNDKQTVRDSLHISETDLDDYQFDHVIDNNGTLEDLYQNLKSLNLFKNVI